MRKLTTETRKHGEKHLKTPCLSVSVVCFLGLSTTFECSRGGRAGLDTPEIHGLLDQQPGEAMADHGVIYGNQTGTQ